METTESVVVPVAPVSVFGHVARLEAYPAWMRLVHAAEVVADEPDPAWAVELRARVGPFARSKQLRMARSECVTDRLAVFERQEVDGRDHACWRLRVELEPSGDDATLVTMHLSYDGSLWTGAVLQKVLDDEIRHGREGLRRLVTDAA